MPLTPEERRDLLLSVGTHKASRRLSPIHVAELLQRLAREKSLEAVAADIGFSETSTIRKFLSLLDFPAELQDLVIFGRLSGYVSFSVAAEIVRASSENIPHLMRAALEHAISKEEARTIVQCLERGGGSLDDCVRAVLNLRPVVEHQHVFLGKLPTTVADDRSAREQLRRGLAQKLGAKNVLSVSTREGRFAFMLTDEGANNPEIRSQLTPTSVDGLVATLLAEAV